MLVRLRLAAGLTMAVCVWTSAAGCLSLGGRTTYVQEAPDTGKWLSALESRVTHLEQSLTTPATETLPAPYPSAP